ncbi:hypothetical protein [Sphingomonas jatrophae]|uniref:Uncharacterized protein n=1 Tax=Sphingomonas jatrophae TaxID=1166337 RepID=A0A1I6K5E6_9SPHN|nr:hypothetical protein [Sphingomonas jatrophae]SFR86462.1 hypothetical protein SAMN05192580_1348 [Sphingomonas jatrophae]
MSSYVEIANLAASKLGADDQLRSPDDDTHVGRSVKAVWDTVRRAAIRDHTWNFAVQRQGLAARAGAPPHPWSFAYPLPATSLRLVEVLNCRRRSDWQLEGRDILTHMAAPLHIRFLTDVRETALWDDAFVEVFACRLAFQIAMRITGDRGIRNDCWADYQQALGRAIRADARENPPLRPEPTGWELARGWSGEPTRFSPNGDPVT